MTEYRYIGSELPFFENAHHWKRYIRKLLAPHIRGDVLEVGAGLGANTTILAQTEYQSWVCLEPDPTLAGSLAVKVSSLDRHRVIVGTVAELSPTTKFDTVLYIDVLEHIEDDSGELARAASRMKPGGKLLIVAPAWTWLYSAFDRAIGHYRRYTKKSLSQLVPPQLRREKLLYLDSVGLLASLGNKLLLHKSIPTAGNVRFWDCVLVPCSRLVDPVLGCKFGRSLVGIWRKTVG